jgi:hypothetical protein
MINKGLVNDQELSWKAKGILVYLLSKPDDWKVIEKDIIKQSKDSRDSVRSGISELIKAGYIIRSENRNRDKKGRLNTYNYDVYEVSSKDGKSNIGKSNVGKSNILLSNDLNNNELSNNELNLNTTSDEVGDGLVHAVINNYYRMYRIHMKREHPILKREYRERAEERIISFSKEYDLDINSFEDISHIFFTAHIQTDYNILHFVESKMFYILCQRYNQTGKVSIAHG